MTVPSAPAIRPRAVCPLLWRCCRGRTERRASSPKAGPGGAARSHHAGCALGCFVHSAEHSASAVLSRQRRAPPPPAQGTVDPRGVQSLQGPPPAGPSVWRPDPQGPEGGAISHPQGVPVRPRPSDGPPLRGCSLAPTRRPSSSRTCFSFWCI